MIALVSRWCNVGALARILFMPYRFFIERPMKPNGTDVVEETTISATVIGDGASPSIQIAS